MIHFFRPPMHSPWLSLLLISTIAATSAAAAETKNSGGAAPVPILLKEDVPAAAVLDIDAQPTVAFQVEVPKDAVLMTVKVTRSPVALEIFASRKEPLASLDGAEHRSNCDTATPRLLVSRQSNPPLEEGTCYVSVGYLGVGPPVVHKQSVKKVPFTVKVSFVRAKVSGILKPGERLAGQTRADEGSVRTFVIDVPPRAKVLRIDLDEVAGTLDIRARHGLPIIRNEDADNTAIGELGRKTLVIDGASPKPLQPGQWYINIVRPLDFGIVPFTVYASFSPDPPSQLLAIPELPRPVDARRRAVHATVEVSTEAGGASGTLLTEDGLVLTNYHVVEEVADGPGEKDAVVIGVTIDPRQPARELFRGNVVATDKKTDLALIQINCGLYRQPLPKGYRFPTVPLGDPAKLEIGDTVSTLGFPEIGNTNGRASITLTQGVLSGFEKTEAGTLLKTDAGISPGSSGGAALDSAWRLIGVPTAENVNPEAVSHMSYVHPISLMPEAWRQMIRQREKAGGGR